MGERAAERVSDETATSRDLLEEIPLVFLVCSPKKLRYREISEGIPAKGISNDIFNAGDSEGIAIRITEDI